jgi:hypothetical protein
MTEELAYKSFWNCHTCIKDLREEFVEAHKALGHQVEKYQTLPNNYKKTEKKEENKL